MNNTTEGILDFVIRWLTVVYDMFFSLALLTFGVGTRGETLYIWFFLIADLSIGRFAAFMLLIRDKTAIENLDEGFSFSCWTLNSFSIENYIHFFRRCVMKRILTVWMATAFILGMTSMGMAGQGMKAGSAEENVPDNIQRSTPSGEKSLEHGSGPGTRSDQLTESKGMTGQGMTSAAAEENVPENIQRSTPSGEKSLDHGSGPGSRADQLTEMEDVDPKNPNLSKKEGKAAQAAKDLKNKDHQSPISSQSSSQKSH